MDIFQTVKLNQEREFSSAIDKTEINVINEFGQNMLHMAVAGGANSIGKELVRRGIEVNRQDSKGQTPLHYAAVHASSELAKAILEAGGDVSIKDSYGNTPLWSAVFNARGKHDLVKLMMRFGPDPKSKNKAGKSPLDFARQINDEALIAILEQPATQ